MTRVALEAPRIALPAWARGWLAAEPPSFPTDAARVRLALRLASENARRGTGGPFGAALFETGSGRLVAAGVNVVVGSRCSLLHAEVMAILLAEHRLRTHDLGAIPGGCELAASAMMCSMCTGAVLWSGVRRVVTSASRADVEAILGFDEGPGRPARELRRRGIEVRSGVLRAEGRRVLAAYAAAGGAIYRPTRA